MTRILALVEGQSEENFVNQVLARIYMPSATPPSARACLETPANAAAAAA